MKRYSKDGWWFFPLIFCFASMVSSGHAASPGAKPSLKQGCSWSRATYHAPWQGRWAHGTAVFDQRVWILGGAIDGDFGGYAGLNDVWYSADGVNWSQATEHAEWAPRFWATVLVFDDKLWIMGGGTAPYDRLNDIWFSEDGLAWTRATASAAWTGRYGHASAVFLDKLWVLGGYEQGNDVWCSGDGVNWELASAQAPWCARAWFSAVVFQDKLWVLGGQRFDRPWPEFNDIWCTEDGVYWFQVSESAGWPIRCAHTTVEYDDKLWILGGRYTVNPGSIHSAIIRRNDVWYSTDGMAWIQADTALWSARSWHTSAAFDDKLWVLGGYYHLNDVWYAEVDHSAAFSGVPVSGAVPLAVQFTDESTATGITAWNWDFGDGATSDQQHPSHEYTVRGMYTVSLTVTAESGTHTETRQDYIAAYGAPHPFHSADTNQDNVFNLSELMRVIQFFNSGGFHCAAGTEDGYLPGSGDDTCALHDADYAPPDWQISLSELLRVVQLYNSRGYQSCIDGEDGFCPGAE